MSKIEIIPAILPMDFNELEEKLGKVAGLVKTVQIDVCDGGFVPSLTWPLKKEDDNFNKILREEEGMPFWQKLNFEIHLMVRKPEDQIEKWVRAGASRIIAHVETVEEIDKLLELSGGLVEFGLAINLNTPNERLEPFIEKVKIIQFMGIEKIGAQGQKFDDRVIGKISELRSKYPEHIISVDGGVNLENAKDLVDAGANRLVVGSALFGSDNITETIREFKETVYS